MANRVTLSQGQRVQGTSGGVVLSGGEIVAQSAPTAGLALTQAQLLTETLGSVQSFTQTGTAAGCTPAAFCSANGLNTQRDAWLAQVGGGISLTAHTLTVDASAGNRLALWWELVPAAGATWSAGTWTVPLDVKVANASLTWSYVAVCRVNSGCASQQKLAESATVNLALSPAGTYTAAVAGVAATPNAGDKVQVILGFTNEAASAQSFVYRNTQTITTPITA